MDVSGYLYPVCFTKSVREVMTTTQADREKAVIIAKRLGVPAFHIVHEGEEVCDLCYIAQAIADQREEDAKIADDYPFIIARRIAAAIRKGRP